MAGSLSVLTYNVQMLESSPVLKNGKRAKEMLPRLKDRNDDVVVFTELFANQQMKTLRDGPVSGFWRTRSGGSRDSGFTFTERPNKWKRTRNGGIRVGTRHRLVESETRVFEHAVTKLHAKGMVYAKIRTDGQYYHVFGTHLQQSCKQKHREARVKQLGELGQFVRDKHVPSDEPIVLAGDFNIGPGREGKCANQTIGDVVRTLDDEGVRIHEMPLDDYTTADGEHLDHVFDANRLLSDGTYRVVHWYLDGGLPSGTFGGRNARGEEVVFLSDHHPLAATVEFRPSRSLQPVPTVPAWLRERVSTTLDGGGLPGSWSG